MAVLQDTACVVFLVSEVQILILLLYLLFHLRLYDYYCRTIFLEFGY